MLLPGRRAQLDRIHEQPNGIVNGTISMAANSMTRFETMIIAMSAMFVALAAAFAYMDRRRERRWKMEQDRYDPGGSR